jgi:hypothetical protein
VVPSEPAIHLQHKRAETGPFSFWLKLIMTTTYRDHTVCGICNVSFYVCYKFQKYGTVHVTNPGNKFSGTAFDAANIGHHGVEENDDVQALVKKPSDQVKPVVNWYSLNNARQEDEEHFLTYRFRIAASSYGSSCMTYLRGGQKFGMSIIKMCSHEDGVCADSFDPTKAYSAVGVPFHWTCLETFRRVSLHKNGRIEWAGLYERGMQKNHAGFKSIGRENASEINHHYNDSSRENIWMHVPGTEWVVANPFLARYSILSAYYLPPAQVRDPREQVFSGDYRLAVGSTGPGAWNYWGPRIKTWRNAMNFQANTYSTATKKDVDVVVKNKTRLLAPSTPSTDASVATRSFNNPANALEDAAGASNVPADDTEALVAPPNPTQNPPSTTAPSSGRDLVSTLAAETLIIILNHLSPEDVATLRLASRKFTEIPMTHFRDRLFLDMPWAFEIYQHNGELRPPPDGYAVDYKEMYRLVRRTAGTGVGSIRAMQNRKRIWEYCERILNLIEEGEDETV